ncbi:MAG: hypothetical protein RL134_635 [Actinomycetota bacterium]|jgi:hypothetical protein
MTTMTHHALCPVTQVPDRYEPCVCIALETVERDALDAAARRVESLVTGDGYLCTDDTRAELIAAIKGDR